MFPQIFGKYVLEREIAAGGMARVYLATLRGAVGFEKRLVVKQIRPELASDDAFVRRFVEEAKTAVELGHPNIVPVYELGVEQGVYYIAMELCEGATLAELLAETGPLSPEEGAYVGIEICRALDYAHRRASIVHRDITPRNAMVDEEGAVRVIDFGIAAPAASDDDGKHRRTEIFGSPGHMPPEQLDGARLTPSTDVFAVGALLIEAWTGVPPFRRANAADSEEAMRTSSPPPLGAHDPRLAELDELIASSVALDPAARPARAELLARPLRDFVKSADLGDVARRLGERVRRTRQRASTSSPWLVGDGLTAATPPTRTPAGPDTPPMTRTPASRDGTPPGPVTRTFAAREDLVEWTRKLPGLDTGAPAPAPSRDDEASPTTANHAARDPARAASGWRLVAALLAGMVIAGLVSVKWLGGAEPRVPAVAKSEAAARIGPRAEPSALPARITSPPPSASGAPAAPSSAAPARFRAAPASIPSPGTGAAERPAGRCTLNLTSQPPARVSVGSRSFASTPVMALQLAPGRYPVTFQSLGVLDERVSATVTLEAGQARGVHADFTSASPRIILR